MSLTKSSPCKVNLLLNILGKRADGMHELETVMQPVNVCDTIELAAGGEGVQLTCNRADLPVDANNLVVRAAINFLRMAGLNAGVRIHLEKRIPVAAGLGGGSGNAATTLLALNELFGGPLNAGQLQSLAAGLGSDVPFFLQNRPALATGRGEKVQSLTSFPALQGRFILLVHPGFGVATAWAYQELAKHPVALHGQPGRAQRLIAALQGNDPGAATSEFYNALEVPALNKFPVLALYQEFFRAHGADVSLMSGSGSTTFAIFPNQAAAEGVIEPFKQQFGANVWIAIVPL